MTLFVDRLRDTCHEMAAKPALVLSNGADVGQVSYGALLSSAMATSEWLSSLGVVQGDRVAVCLPKCLAAIQLHLGACSMGAISLPLNPAYSKPELDYLMRDSEARVLVVESNSGLADESERAPAVPGGRLVPIDTRRFSSSMRRLNPNTACSAKIGPKTPALMLYTSGTTGRPKGACMSHGSLTANMDMLRDAWQWNVDDSLLHVLPLFHVHGLLVALHGALHVGASTVLHGKFDAAATVQDLQSGSITVFMGVPTVYRRILAEIGDAQIHLPAMRLLTSGSDRLPVEVFRAIECHLGHTVVERYGMTEAGIILSNPLDGKRVEGQVGVPLGGVQMRVVDPSTGKPTPRGKVGELQTRGPHLFLGYWRDPSKTRESFTEDGWFRTGDLGQCDANGYYEIKGRQTDLIISGGMNVYPAEVEHVLARHPGVAQCAVVGLPDPEWGEAVTAFVIPGNKRPEESDLIHHCRASLAPYKAPKCFRFVQSLPRNAMGKVQKKALLATSD